MDITNDANNKAKSSFPGTSFKACFTKNGLKKHDIILKWFVFIIHSNYSRTNRDTSSSRWHHQASGDRLQWPTHFLHYPNTPTPQNLQIWIHWLDQPGPSGIRKWWPWGLDWCGEGGPVSRRIHDTGGVLRWGGRYPVLQLRRSAHMWCSHRSHL